MNDVSALESYLLPLFKQLINKALISDVAPAMQDCMRRHINEDVYGVYDPKFYRRRYEQSGLLDYKNIHLDFHPEKCELVLKNIAQPTGKHASEDPTILSQFIEYGQSFADIPERPFVENTRKELIEGGICEQALYDGLKRLGINIKK